MLQYFLVPAFLHYARWSDDGVRQGVVQHVSSSLGMTALHSLGGELTATHCSPCVADEAA